MEAKQLTAILDQLPQDAEISVEFDNEKNGDATWVTEVSDFRIVAKMKIGAEVNFPTKKPHLWVGRDSNGLLFLYPNKPQKGNGFFNSRSNIEIDAELFPEVTFENSPQKVELRLIER